MFKSIKLRIIKGRQLLPFAVAKVLQEHEDKLSAISGDDVTELADIAALKETVGDADSGLVKDTASLKSKVAVLEAYFTHELSFTVNDGTDPIQGATVTIEGKTGTTGSAGGCTIEGILEGSHTVTVTKEGFTEYTDTITVSSESTSFTVSLVVDNPGE